MSVFNDDPFEVIPGFDAFDREISEFSITGYALFLHSNIWRSRFVYANLPTKWAEQYHRHNLVVIDSSFLWAMVNSGSIRWDEAARQVNVTTGYEQEFAAQFGMRFGGIASVKSKHLDEKRCMLFTTCADRQLTDEELLRSEQILTEIVKIHDGRLGMSDLDIQTIQSLAAGMSQDEIAEQFKLTREAIKKRISRIKSRIRARNTAHVVSIAHKHALI